MARRPNILMVMSDHHNGYALGSEPGSPAQTPVMDRLAAEGLSFTQFRTPSPMCAPARAALMTGLYCHANGMWNNNHTPAAMRLDIYPHLRTWSENLRDADYRLRYIGKWHVSATRSPSAFGWEEPGLTDDGRRTNDERRRTNDAGRRMEEGRGGAATRGQEGGGQRTEGAGSPAPGVRPSSFVVRPVDRLRRAGRGQQLLINALYQEREGWPRRILYGTTLTPPEELGDGRLTTRAVQLIEEQAGWDEPWCLYVGWSNPHDPYVAHERYLRQYDVSEIPQPPSYGDDLRDKPNVYRRLHEQLWGHLDWPDVAQMIRHYYAMITFLDEQLGRILEALERSGQADNTIVVYTSDHGDYAGAHGLFAKGVPSFDEAYRVPLLVRWPAGLHGPGRRVDAFTNLMDLGPTLLELAGAAPLQESHGRSLAPFLRGEAPADWPQEFVGEFLGHENFYTQRLIRTRQHKYVWNAFDYDELYDLTQDPWETRNLQTDSAHEGVKRDLIARLWRWAIATDDIILNAYPLNAIMPYGPGIASPSSSSSSSPGY